MRFLKKASFEMPAAAHSLNIFRYFFFVRLKAAVFCRLACARRPAFDESYSASSSLDWRSLTTCRVTKEVQMFY